MYGNGFGVADAGEGPGEAREARAPSLILDQNEVRRAEKIFFRRAPLYRGLDDRPPYLWDRHWFVT